MDPATILTLVSLLSSLIAKAPAIVDDVKSFISALFGKGLIDVATQKALHDWVDANCAAALKGEVPVAWTVEADPTN